MFWFFFLVLILETKMRLSLGNDAFVVFQSGLLVFQCESKDTPVWSWLGKNPTGLITMAVGDRKQNRFTDPRWLSWKTCSLCLEAKQFVWCSLFNIYFCQLPVLQCAPTIVGSFKPNLSFMFYRLNPYTQRFGAFVFFNVCSHGGGSRRFVLLLNLNLLNQFFYHESHGFVLPCIGVNSPLHSFGFLRWRFLRLQHSL